MGAAGLAYALLFLCGPLGFDVVWVWFAWVALLDSPHFFATYARTYLDRQERRSRKRLLWGSLAILVAGPFALLLAFLLWRGGVVEYTMPWSAFLSGFGLWAYWHIVRQHHGFVRLYQRRNGEAEASERTRDAIFLHATLLLPFATFVARHPETGPLLAFSEDPARGRALGEAATAAVAALGAAYGGRQALRAARGLPLNLPKLLFLAAVVPANAIVCSSPTVLGAPLFTFGAFVTIAHDLQYLALVWHFQQRRATRLGTRALGAAGALVRSMPAWILAALVFGVAGRRLGCGLAIHPGCAPLLTPAD